MAGESSTNKYSFLDENVQSIISTPNQPFGFTVGQDTTLSDVFAFVLFFMLAASGVAAMGRILYALGLRILNSDNEAKITEANKIITTSLTVLLGSFSLVLLFMAVNPDIVSGNLDFNKIKTTNSAPATSPATSYQTNQNSVAHTYAERLKSHNDIVARLAPSGIHTNHNDAPCTEAQFSQTTPSCTSLAFLSEETIQLLLNINSACHCTLIISGATEPGHANGGAHREGSRAVDLRIKGYPDTSDPLYTYIKGIGAVATPTSVCYTKFSWGTFTFCDEKPLSNSTWAPHFHVQ